MWKITQKGYYDMELNLEQAKLILKDKVFEIRKGEVLAEKAIDIVLTELERLQKENEEYSKQLDLDYVHNNYISKQEIKNKIEVELKKAEKDLQEAIRLEKEAKEKEEATLWWTAQIRLDERIKVLKEILKGVKKDGNGDNV